MICCISISFVYYLYLFHYQQPLMYKNAELSNIRKFQIKFQQLLTKIFNFNQISEYNFCIIELKCTYIILSNFTNVSHMKKEL